MSETLTVRFNANFVAQLINQLALQTPAVSPSLSIATVLANGTGNGAANQIYIDQRTLLPSSGTNINVQTFSGSLNGAIGSALNMARVKMMVIQNLNGTEANSLTVGGAGAGAWTPFFNGNTSYKVSVPGGGNFIAIAPGATGYPVGSSSGTLLNVANLSSTGTVQFNLYVVGANG
jgi:hypothetical protein